jgi:hypothetical protein
MNTPNSTTPGLQLQPLPNGVMRASHGKGAVEFWFPRSNVAVGRYTGTPTAELFSPVIEAMKARLPRELRLHVFADLGAIDGFEPSFRERWRAWFCENRPAVASCHVLFSSRLVAIGIGILSVALGGPVQTYSQREEFERALQRAGL